MTTVYTQYYAMGKWDRENERAMRIPSTLDKTNAFRGYMDGYSGSPRVEPVPKNIKFKPRETIN
jgi:hypothetical protein